MLHWPQSSLLIFHVVYSVLVLVFPLWTQDIRGSQAVENWKWMWRVLREANGACHLKVHYKWAGNQLEFCSIFLDLFYCKTISGRDTYKIWAICRPIRSREKTTSFGIKTGINRGRSKSIFHVKIVFWPFLQGWRQILYYSAWLSCCLI